MDANTKAASDAIAQLTTEQTDNTARIARLTARNVVITAQLAALQPMVPAPAPAAQTQGGK